MHWTVTKGIEPLRYVDFASKHYALETDNGIEPLGHADFASERAALEIDGWIAFR